VMSVKTIFLNQKSIKFIVIFSVTKRNCFF